MGRTSLLGFAAVIAVALVGAGRDARAEELRLLTLEPSPDLPAGKPDPLLVTTGAVIFAVPYVFGVFGAAASNVDADKWLYVPVAGPWGDLIARLTCTNSSTCKGDLGPTALPLALAGLGQAAGVGILIKALIDPPKGNRVADKSVHFAPATYVGGAGMQAYGAF